MSSGMYLRTEKHKGKNAPNYKDGRTLKKYYCTNCGKELSYYTAKRCQSCANRKNFSGKNNPNWQGGNSFKPYSPKFNNNLKEKIRNRDNKTCQLCNKTEKQNGRNLSIHHIDYNKKNSNPNNLITLCISCNFKVNYNRNYWIKYFRKK